MALHGLTWLGWVLLGIAWITKGSEKLPFFFQDKVNYPTTKDDWASCFTAICLLFPKEVRSLTIAPHVYSQVPYEVFKSYTDYANIQNLFLIAKWSLTSHKLKICGFYAPLYKKASLRIFG